MRRFFFFFLLVLVSVFFYSTKVQAAIFTEISPAPGEHWAWNDIIGWIDFYFDDIRLYADKLTGYASSSVGYVALNCEGLPTPPADCATTYSRWRILHNIGNFSGWAWNESIGWISFDCHNPDNPGGDICLTSNYQVSVDQTGNFWGWAWNDAVGWIDFNCGNDHDPFAPGIQSICGSSNFRVKTANLPPGLNPIIGTVVSSIFDTGYANGVAFNSIFWKGNQPSYTAVKFQFASANSPASFPEPIGPGGTSLSTDVYISTGPEMPVLLNRIYHNNHRYFRYKIILESNLAQTTSPTIDDVIINWSP